jgi:hypothetical protein
MDEAKALDILTTLASGVNPLSGEVFTSDSPYQASEIVRALFVAVRALERNAKPESGGTRASKPRSDLPANVGKPWTSEEDNRLVAAFDRGQSTRELAGAHGRTLAGIEARLEKLGRLEPTQRVTSNRYGAPRTAQSAAGGAKSVNR